MSSWFCRSKNTSVNVASKKVQSHRKCESFERRWFDKRVNWYSGVLAWEKGTWFCLEMASIM